MPVASLRPYHWYDPGGIKTSHHYKKKKETLIPAEILLSKAKDSKVKEFKATFDESEFINALLLFDD